MPIHFEFRTAGTPGDLEEYAWRGVAHRIGIPTETRLHAQSHVESVGTVTRHVRVLSVCAGADEGHIRSQLRPPSDNSSPPDLTIVAALSPDPSAFNAAKVMAEAARGRFVDATRLLYVEADSEVYALNGQCPQSSAHVKAGPKLFSANSLRGRRASRSAWTDGISPEKIKALPPGDVCVLIPHGAVEEDLDAGAVAQLKDRGGGMCIRSGRLIRTTIVEALRPFCENLEPIAPGKEEATGTPASDAATGKGPSPRPLELKDEVALLEAALEDSRLNVLPPLPELIGTVLDEARPMAVAMTDKLLNNWSGKLERGDEARRVIADAFKNGKPYDVGTVVINDALTAPGTVIEDSAAMSKLDPIETLRLRTAGEGSSDCVAALESAIEKNANESYRRLVTLIEVYLQRFVATTVGTHVGDALSQLPTNSFLPKPSLAWATATQHAITETVSRVRADYHQQKTFERVSEVYKARWNPKMILHPAWRLGGRLMTVILGLYAALVISDAVPVKDNAGGSLTAPIIIAAIVGVVVIFFQGRPSLRDSRQKSHEKLQAKLEKEVCKVQKAIHTEVSALIRRRLAAWEKDFKAKLSDGIREALGESGREKERLWIDRVNALELELARLKQKKKPDGNKADQSRPSTRARDVNRALRRRETWEGTLLEGTSS